MLERLGVRLEQQPNVDDSAPDPICPQPAFDCAHCLEDGFELALDARSGGTDLIPQALRHDLGYGLRHDLASRTLGLWNHSDFRDHRLLLSTASANLEPL
jgi:hypothetical protein